MYDLILTMKEYPKRHSNHIIQTRAEKGFSLLVPDELIINDFRKDYGTDYDVEIVENNNAIGIHFSVQLKGIERVNKNSSHLKLKGIRRSNINRWLNRLEPTLLVAYDVEEKVGYWVWVDSSFVDLSRKSQSFIVKIPIANQLTDEIWDSIISHVKKVHALKYAKLPVAEPEDNEISELAWSHLQQGDFDLAAHYYKKCLSRANKSAKDHHNLAICQYEIKNYDKAIVQINQSLDSEQTFDSKFAKASILTEMAALKHDKLIATEGAEIFADLIEERPTAELFYNYANALQQRGDFKEAAINYRHSLKLFPNNDQAWCNLGNTLVKLKKYDKAMKAYDCALRLNPDLPQALFNKGKLLVTIGDVEDAISLLESSYDTIQNGDDDFKYMEFHIADAHHRNQDLETALTWNKIGSSKNPGDDYYLNQRSKIYAKGRGESLFDPHEVLSFYENYLENKQGQINRGPTVYEVIQLNKELGKTIAEQWSFIQSEFSLYERYSEVILNDLSIDESDFLESLKSYELFDEFRIKNPNNRHFIVLEEISIGLPFDKLSDLMDVLLSVSFGYLTNFLVNKTQRSLRYSDIDFTEVYEYLNNIYPQLALTLYDSVSENKNGDIVISLISQYVSRSASSEMVRQIGFLASVMGGRGKPKFLDDEKTLRHWEIRFMYEAGTIIHKNRVTLI